MSTTASLDVPSGSDQRMSGFGYGVGVSVGILLLITTITLASYFCTRPPPDADSHARAAALPAGDLEAGGVDAATLATYPKLLYSQAKQQRRGGEGSTAETCCSICLADYRDSDMLRMLPECKHLFHLGCVDPWLASHPTCPVCRTSPLPSPMATPQMEVVPLAVRPHRS